MLTEEQKRAKEAMIQKRKEKLTARAKLAKKYRPVEKIKPLMENIRLEGAEMLWKEAKDRVYSKAKG